MKKFLSQFRQSLRLDQPRDEPSGPGGAGPRLDAELLRLDEQLRREDAATPEPSPWLHGSIMSAVKRAPTQSEDFFSKPRRWKGWSFVGGTAAVLIAVGVMNLGPRDQVQPPSGPPPAPGVSAMLPLVNQTTANVAGLVTTSLEEELRNINRDLDRTTEFLLARLP